MSDTVLTDSQGIERTLSREGINFLPGDASVIYAHVEGFSHHAIALGSEKGGLSSAWEHTDIKPGQSLEVQLDGKRYTLTHEAEG